MEALASAETIELTTTPHPRADLVLEQVDDECVVFSPAGHTHYLDAVATPVWQCLDGATTLDELSADIAAVSGSDRAEVERNLLTLVRKLGDRGLLDGVTPAPAWQPIKGREVPHGESRRYIPVSMAECARRTHESWAPTRTVLVGSYLLGLRSATPALDELMRYVVQDHLLEDAHAPPNYSLRLAGPDGTHSHRLLRACETPLQTTSLRRLLHGVCGFLASHGVDHDDRYVHVGMPALVHDGSAVLLNPGLSHLRTPEADLADHGFRVLDSPTVALDPATGELVVEGPGFRLDQAVLDAAALIEPEPDGVPDVVAPGRYPVRLWLDVQLADGTGKTPTRGTLVAGANRRVRNRDAVGAATALATLARAAVGARPASLMHDTTSADGLRRVLQLLGESADQAV